MHKVGYDPWVTLGNRKNILFILFILCATFDIMSDNGVSYNAEPGGRSVNLQPKGIEGIMSVEKEDGRDREREEWIKDRLQEIEKELREEWIKERQEDLDEEWTEELRSGAARDRLQEMEKELREEWDSK